MEMVDRPIYANWFLYNLPMTFSWNGQDVMIAEIAGRSPTKEEVEVIKTKFKCLDTDAKDLYLCRNGEVLFRVEE